jgi:hypothetical protein
MQTNPESHELGYYFYPQNRAGRLGHPRLDILLRSTPSERHFDPEKVHLFILSPQNDIEALVIDHPWRSLKRYRLVPGRVIIEDRRGKAVEAFTYGGDLEINANDERTLCMLVSPAAILDLSADAGISRLPATGLSAGQLLAQETEILLAERRAAWARDPDQYETRLAGVDPAALYAACLSGSREIQAHSYQGG